MLGRGMSFPGRGDCIGEGTEDVERGVSEQFSMAGLWGGAYERQGTEARDVGRCQVRTDLEPGGTDRALVFCFRRALSGEG